MSKDPIVDEVRAIRDAIAREHGYDLGAIFRMLREAEAQSGREHVSPLPPKVEPLPKAAQQGSVLGSTRRSERGERGRGRR